jgi:hypothetical protein
MTVTFRAPRSDLAHDLVLPTLLFSVLGGMTWAVRGCSGFGAVAGCIFAGVTWGAAWWFLAQSPSGERTRRYDSGWIVLALTIGIGLSGARGWMQWPSFFEGKLVTNAARGEFVPIPRSYGFLWLFIAGVPWAGIGACLLAWCGSIRETRAWHWVIRIACGLGGAALARYLFTTYPQYFLPLYDSLEPRYHDLAANPTLRRLINDCNAAVAHMGYYLGFLLYEVARREGKNVVLILTVGLVNGAGWAFCQNWKWAPGFWQGSNFNFWRCWESSGGISIGIAYGIAYYFVNREMLDKESATLTSRRSIAETKFERLLVYLGLAWLSSLFLRPALGGWGNLYFSVVMLFGAAYCFLSRLATVTNPHAVKPEAGAGINWGAVGLTTAAVASLWLSRGQSGWYILLGSGLVLALGFAWSLSKRSTFDDEAQITTHPGGDPNLERWGLYLGLLTGLGLSVRNGLKGWFNIYRGNEDYWSRRLWEVLGPAYLVCLVAIAVWVLLRPYRGDRRFPHAYGLIWLVLIVQNVIAQLITGPLTQWNEMAFSIYYMLLFFISATIVFHYHAMRRPSPP